MTQATVPTIYAPRLVRDDLGVMGRLVAVAIFVAATGVLVLAAYLTPNPAGSGTHEQLGLRGCQFLQTTGLPCPSCGMTSSFAWFARGNLLASLYVQPMGAALAFLTAVTAWSAIYAALTARPVYRLLRLLPGRYYLLPLMALGVFAWGWKILIHLNGADGWR